MSHHDIATGQPLPYAVQLEQYALELEDRIRALQRKISWLEESNSELRRQVAAREPPKYGAGTGVHIATNQMELENDLTVTSL